MPPGIAGEDILVVRSASCGPQRGLDAALNPAMGTLVFSPDQDLIIRKTLMREFSRIKRRLFIRRFFLQLDYLASKGRCSVLRGFGYLFGYLGEG